LNGKGCGKTARAMKNEGDKGRNLGRREGFRKTLITGSVDQKSCGGGGNRREQGGEKGRSDTVLLTLAGRYGLCL